MSMDNNAKIIRTLCFVPAHIPERILEMADHGMDGLCLDLEDLTPLGDKGEARRIFREVAKQLTERGTTVFARTNGLTDGAAADDLEAIVCPELHCVSIPKVNRPEEVTEFCSLLAEAEASHGLPDGYTLVRPIIETAMGVVRAYEIAAASPRIAYMGGVAGGFWGDISSSLGYIPTPGGEESRYVRSKVLVDVRAAGVPFPIGGGMTSRHDVETARAFAIENRNLGYNGVHCPSPAEVIEAVNEVFTPTMDDIDRWLELMPQLEQAEAEGITATQIGNVTVDLAGLVRVRQQLDLARRVGLIKE
jgi:citrate lyase subunit beta / citryl-CoA lyase